MWWVRWKPHKDYGLLKAAFQGHDGLKYIEGWAWATRTPTKQVLWNLRGPSDV